MKILPPVGERSDPMAVQPHSQPLSNRWLWVFDIIFLLVLVIGAYFRTVGINWDEYQHLHPDERFLTMVESAIHPVQSAAEYFDTQESSLNPHNVGYTFFVYGSLPIFIVRYVGEWVSQTGYDQIHLIGRQLSAIADLLTVMLVYLIASRLYDRRVGLLASIFSALAVLQIQLSHFWTVDTFTNFFTFAAFYFAIRVMLWDSHPEPHESVSGARWKGFARQSIYYILFGLALGMAVASKVSAIPLAILLPGAALIRISRLDRDTLKHEWLPILGNLVLAGAVSFLVFRICQPYAFSGPGFFNITPNPEWVQNLRELSAQSSGDVDAPFALQWARRPIWFAWENMVKWGLGVPLGLAAWIGFFWMGWRILKGEWRTHILVWIWTLAYFSWQSINWVRSMRYQLLVYPTLVIIAAWAIVRLWDYHRKREGAAFPWTKLAAGGIALVVVLGTFGWAYAFTRIYTRPVTRVAASEWIYKNVPGPINLQIDTGEATVNYPLPYRAGATVRTGVPLRFSFQAVDDGYLTSVALENLYDQLRSGEEKSLTLRLVPAGDPEQVLSSVTLMDPFLSNGNPSTLERTFPLPAPVLVKQGERYEMTLEAGGPEAFLGLLGPVTLNLESLDTGREIPQVLPFPVQIITPSSPYLAEYRVSTPGVIHQITIPHLVDLAGGSENKTVRLTLSGSFDNVQQVGTASISDVFAAENDPRGQAYTFELDEPVVIDPTGSYLLTLALAGGEGELAVYGSWPANESTWDDAIPVPLERFSPYGDTSFIYRGDLNFQMYWNDNPDKLNRFLSILQQADYLFMTSNRQWGTIPRVPERYPLTSLYYRELIGCPPQEDLLWCYNVAAPGTFRGRLGYELVQVFQSDPNIGSWRINDQFAEEAFTVYDHPKVMIFQRTERFDLADVASRLSTADLSHVMALTPGKATKASNNLMLPSHLWAKQQAGGTYADLFDPQSLLNRYPWVSVVAWYLAVAALGWVVYPLVRLALPGLSDRGFPLARITGMLVLAYLVWLGGSLGLAVTRLMITWAIFLLVLTGAILAYIQRRDLLHELRVRKGYFLTVEGIALLFFCLDLLIRLGNPDLWHPNYGGERPMNFSYFNAILKSTTFPPYDPWYSGGYINYYYYGYVVVGVLVKWLGITPSVAFNLILPTLFSLLALGAFSVGWNLYTGRKAIFPKTPPPDDEDEKPEDEPPSSVEAVKPFAFLSQPAFAIGLAGAVGFALLGNLGTLRMIWYGFQRLAVPVEATQGANFFARMAWTFQGMIAYIQGAKLPYTTANWYWIPSRAIPTPGETEPITEFPFFTILYSDLHAHLIALPITLLILGWIVSVILRSGRWGEENGSYSRLGGVLGFLVGGLAIGALRPTNTWDFYTYLLLGGLALLYANLRHIDHGKRPLTLLSSISRKVVLAGASIGILVVLAFLLYQPFSEWYRQGYNSVEIWKGLRTPFWSYLTHWGLFLFVIVSWMLWETHQWLSTTPMSALKKLRSYRGLIQGGLLIAFSGIVLLTLVKVQIGWAVVGLGVWATLLMFRPGLPDTKRLTLFLVGSGLFLTLFVELFVLRGDIGRMNTVFKFYLQVWTFFAIAAAASLGWLLEGLDHWSPKWFPTWSVVFTALVLSAALFPLMAGMAKIRDRMAPNVPITLDSMAYMNYAYYADAWGDMDLSQDYRAIRWLQQNVPGSPVIVEANLRQLYRWGSRMTVYTGLPGVVGWEWHQQQQRVVVPPGWVTDRILEIEKFYRTTDESEARAFLEKYNVGYIVVGQQERGMYPGPGLEKFPAYDGILWQEVYRDGDTVIYQSACECSPF